MKTSLIPLVVGAAALLGFGVWLGHSSSSASPAATALADPTAPAAPTTSTPSRLTRAVQAPSLAKPVPSARASSGLAADLRERDPKIRRAAVKEAAGDRELDPAVLLAASRDPDREVGVIATEALGRLYADGSVTTSDMIARATDHNLDERVRTSALNGLGLVPNPDAAATLTGLLASGDIGERRSAAILLVHQVPALAIPALIRALGDADEYVRSNALESLKLRSRGRDFGTDAAGWQAWWQSQSR